MRRFLALVLLLVTCYLLPVTPTYAQQSSTQVPPVQTNPYLNTNTNPDVPQNMNTWTQNIMINIIASGICQIAGVNPVSQDQRCLGIDSKTGKIGFLERQEGQVGGALGVATNLIAATFTHPPASTREYLSYMENKFGVAEKAYAQGTGFTGLSPLMNIWVAFRNIAYLAFVIVFVLIGLMIMLRVKIDPRTVMTIQNSIPRIIIGLILVTFSFAIAGFLIDMMYVVIFLFFGLFSNMNVSSDFTTALDTMRQHYQDRNVLWVAKDTVGFRETIAGVAGAIKDSIAVSFGATPQGFQPLPAGIGAGVGGAVTALGLGALAISLTGVGAIIAVVLGVVLGGIVGAFSGGGLGEIAGAFPGLLALLIITFVLLWALFRLLFALIQAYIWILIDVVFAPLWVLGGMFPGSPVSFSQWLRDIIAQLSAFPTTIFMLLLGKAFIEGFGSAASSGNGFAAPLIGAQSVDAIKAFIGLGIILLTPQVVTMVKDAFKAPKFPYGAAVGQAIGAGAAVPGGVRNIPTLVMAGRYGGGLGVAQYMLTGHMPYPYQHETGSRTTTPAQQTGQG